MVGLNALAEFAEKLAAQTGGNQQNLQIGISLDEDQMQSFKPLTQENKIVLQSIEVRYIEDQVSIMGGSLSLPPASSVTSHAVVSDWICCQGRMSGVHRISSLQSSLPGQNNAMLRDLIVFEQW